MSDLLRVSEVMPDLGGTPSMSSSRWALRALRGEIRLGRIFVRAGKPIALASEIDVRGAVLEVRFDRLRRITLSGGWSAGSWV